jgi:pyruvate formate lyase activating enzyme
MYLFNIQKYCIHDGPGIRTAVFFKGCPLRCKWCSNPESQAVGLQDERGKALAGREYSMDEVLKVCLEDREFYAESGGGITLTGGEALLQPRAAAELLKALKAEGLHTALETCGHAPREAYRSVTDSADLLLFDLKHHDGAKHREGTGADNVLILENLKFSLEGGSSVVVRIPVIPGYNDSLADAAEFTALIKSMGIEKVQLLPFHQFGKGKYSLLNMVYEYSEYKTLHPEDLADYSAVFNENGIDCYF